jgi:hypothetical protein
MTSVLITCARSAHAVGSTAKERKAVAHFWHVFEFSRPIATGGGLSNVDDWSWDSKGCRALPCLRCGASSPTMFLVPRRWREVREASLSVG